MKKFLNHTQGNSIFVYSFMATWLIASVAFSISRNGWNADAFTRLTIFAYFAISLGWYLVFGRSIRIKNPRKTFLSWSLANALVGETCYMISKPLHDSLLITPNLTATQMLRNWGVDLILTAPAYFAIFSVIWYLLQRFSYSPIAYFLLIPLGQTLGDGNSFFWLNPGTLILIPYIMLNYWAMSFVPFLVVRPQIHLPSRPINRIAAYLLPIAVLPIVYFLSAAVILTLGRSLGWLPSN